MLKTLQGCILNLVWISGLKGKIREEFMFLVGSWGTRTTKLLFFFPFLLEVRFYTHWVFNQVETDSRENTLIKSRRCNKE